MAPTEEKEHFYKKLNEEYQKYKGTYAVYEIGDWNARIQKATNKYEAQIIGKYTFNAERTTLKTQVEGNDASCSCVPCLISVQPYYRFWTHLHLRQREGGSKKKW